MLILEIGYEINLSNLKKMKEGAKACQSPPAAQETDNGHSCGQFL